MSIEDSLYKFLSTYKKLPDWSKRILAAPLSFFPRTSLLGKSYHFFNEEARLLEHATEEEIEEYQFLKIKALLQHCYNTVPFYRETWNEYGVDVNRVGSLEDFVDLVPCVTRDMVQSTPERFLSSAYTSGQRLPMNSGGSTGIPLKLYYLKGTTRAAEWAHMHVQWSRVGYKMGNRMATLRGDYIGKERIHSFDSWRNTLVLSSFNLVRDNADSYLDLLRKYEVEFINAYPASLFNLIRLSKQKHGIIPSLKVILLGSENIVDWQLEQFKEFFKTDRVYYWYGHGEVCALGGGCEVSSDYHFLPSYSFVEFVKNDKLEDNMSGVHEIVGTSFVNPCMPLIRYRTQDYGAVNIEPCACHRNHKRLSRVIGREQEIAVGSGGERITLTALIFGRHAEYFNHIIKMQLINTEPGKLIVKVVPKESFSDMHIEEIQDSLSPTQGMPFETQVKEVSEIPGSAGGKHRFLLREFSME
jgi:phenylacetate-coenzyme A ligase PaaK-like adenylate-forming protein